MRRFHLEGPGLAGLMLRLDSPPTPGPGQVLIAMRANSLNARDRLVLEGYLRPAPGVVPVSDGAGMVVAVGEGVTRISVGDRVVGAFRQGWIDGPLAPGLPGAADLGCARDGMLGEWALLDAEGVVHIPATMTIEDAACFPCAGVTAWSALQAGRPVSAGDTVLILGSGGVSLFALQLARLAGARVIATTASAARGEKLRALGASAVINYHTTPDWQDEVLKHTGGQGVDRVVEVGGGGTLERSIRCVRIEGVIALVGLLAVPSRIDPTPIMARALTLKGISVGSRLDLEKVLRRFAEAELSPVIDRRFSFEAAADALACLGGSDRFGKLVITYPEP